MSRGKSICQRSSLRCGTVHKSFGSQYTLSFRWMCLTSSPGVFGSFGCPYSRVNRLPTFHLQCPRDYYKPFLKGVQRADQRDPGNLALTVLAHQRGGQVFDGDKNLAGDIARCIADLQSNYVLSFDSPVPTQDIEYRALQITVGKQGSAHVRTLLTILGLRQQRTCITSRRTYRPGSLHRCSRRTEPAGRRTSRRPWPG
jgi:hypothetical protein